MKFRSLFAQTDRSRLSDGTYCKMENPAIVNIDEQNNSVVVSVDVLALSCRDENQVSYPKSVVLM